MMLQVKLDEPEKLVFREIDTPDIGDDQVLIKIRRIGVCGSDIHAYYGEHPYISCPIVQGHEFSGEIAALGNKVDKLKKGQMVTVMPQLVCGECRPCAEGRYNICENLEVIGCQSDGAAQEFFAADANLIVPLPEGMSLDEGAMVEPVAVGVHAVKRLGDVKGKNILVLGAGPIGNLTAQSALGLGARSVIITDISDYRLEAARQCGILQTVNVSAGKLELKIGDVFGQEGPDGILECAGAEESINQAITTAPKGTDIIVVAVFSRKIKTDMGLVQDKELRLIGSLMYREKDYAAALRLIQEDKVHVDPLITRHFPLDQYDKAYKYIEANREKTMKVLIDVNT
jgi:L-iditol 2-dehydrogenase